MKVVGKFPTQSGLHLASFRKIERPSFFFVRQAVSPIIFYFGSTFLPGAEKLGL